MHKGFIMKNTLLSLFLSLFLVSAGFAAGASQYAPAQDCSSKGIFGKIDKQSAQRGMQVYKEVCAACHSLRLISFRHLTALGYDNNQVKVLASEFEINDGPNEDGENFTRAGIPADYFPNPYSNEVEARLVNNGALPPDLSLIVKARNFGRGNLFLNLADALSGNGSAAGSDYIYALLTGYKDAPAGVNMQDGMLYNTWFSGNQIAMANPLSDGLVEYSDGTEATVEQMARDVTTFLAWTAEPELEKRRSMGIKIMAFLLLLFGFTLAAKRTIWASVKH